MAQRFDGLYHRDIGYSRQVPQRLKATSIATVNRRAEGPAPPKADFCTDYFRFQDFFSFSSFHASL